MFVKDLLDGVNGMILDHKDRQDNEIKPEVESWQKILAWGILLLSSIGMLYYVYLFAMLQSTSRQHAWFNSFQVWLIFEVLIISTGLVLIEHVFIPLWSMKEVQKVKERIVSDIILFQNKVRSKKGNNNSNNINNLKKEDEINEEDPRSFNAAEYLYPSFRIAQLFPKYSESELILQYKTPWPKKSFKGKEKSTRKRYDKRFEFIPKTIGRVVVFAVSNLIQLPSSIQNMGLQMMLMTLCGYLVKFHIMLFEISPFLPFLPTFLLSTFLYVIFLSSKKKPNKQLPTYPLQTPEEKEQDQEQEEKSNHQNSSVIKIDQSRLCDAIERIDIAKQIISNSESDFEVSLDDSDSSIWEIPGASSSSSEDIQSFQLLYSPPNSNGSSSSSSKSQKESDYHSASSVAAIDTSEGEEKEDEVKIVIKRKSKYRGN